MRKVLRSFETLGRGFNMIDLSTSTIAMVIVVPDFAWRKKENTERRPNTKFLPIFNRLNKKTRSSLNKIASVDNAIFQKTFLVKM